MEVLPLILTSTGFCETAAFTPLTGKSPGYNLQLQFYFKLDKSQGRLRGIETLCLWYYLFLLFWYRHLRYQIICSYSPIFLVHRAVLIDTTK
jgi:hypothetical protein